MKTFDTLDAAIYWIEGEPVATKNTNDYLKDKKTILNLTSNRFNKNSPFTHSKLTPSN